MKKQNYILAIVGIGTSVCLFGQGNVKDTIFIRNDDMEPTSRLIYVEPNRNSLQYDKVSSFEFEGVEHDSYQYSIDFFEEKNIPLIKNTPIIPKTKWVALFQLDGTYYTYQRCDFNSHSKVNITDTAFIEWTGEGPLAYQVVEQKKIDANTFSFKLSGIYVKNRELVVHIIDKNRGIAVFEESQDGSRKEYYLMIATDQLKEVGLLVHKCDQDQFVELDFDYLDYRQLLEAK
jgi:hypothetical protein